jgi:hypothetical protein
MDRVNRVKDFVHAVFFRVERSPSRGCGRSLQTT